MRPTKPNTKHSWNHKNPKTRKYGKSSLPNKKPSQGRKKQFKAKPLPHKLIDDLLLGFEKKKSSPLQVTNHAFYALEQLTQNLAEPYPQLLQHVEEPLREAIYHNVHIDKPYFHLLPKLRREEQKAIEEDGKWQQRCPDAKKNKEDLRRQYKEDQLTAATLKEKLVDSKRVESNLRKTLHDLTKTQDEELKQLDIVKERLRAAKVERDRQAKALYEARKKHESVTDELKMARQKLAEQHQQAGSDLVPAENVKKLYEQIEEAKTELKMWEEKRDNMRLWYEDAKAKFSDVQAYEKQLINETEIMLQQHEIFKQSYTPRPDWDRILDTTPELFQALKMEKFSDLLLHLNEGEASESSSSSSSDENEEQENEENDRDLATEKHLDTLIERKKRARRRAALRAKQFHSSDVKLSDRGTHQAHHIHHLHRKHKKEHKRRRQEAKVNRRLTAVSKLTTLSIQTNLP